MRSESGLVRGVGFLGLCALVINGMVGSGIFALPYALAQRVGGWTPVVLLAMGVALIPLVFVMARLAAMFDRTGGPVAYVQDAFGGNAAFVVGWLQILSVASATAANANALSDYLFGSVAGGTSALIHAAATFAGLVLAVGLNVMPSRRTAGVLVLASVCKLAPLVLIGLFAWPHLGVAPASTPAETWAPLQAVLLACYAMIGFENALTMAGEARNPERDMPRALFLVYGLCTLIYALVAAAYCTTVFAPGKADSAPVATLAKALFGDLGGVLVLFAVAWSILGNMTINMLGNSRRIFAMEQQGDLPRGLGRLHPGLSIPINAVALVGVLTVGLALSGGFVVLAVLSVAARLAVYLSCVAALPMVRRRRALGVRGLEWAAIIAAGGLCCWLILQSKPENWLAMLAAVASGLALRAVARRLRSRVGA